MVHKSTINGKGKGRHDNNKKDRNNLKDLILKKKQKELKRASSIKDDNLKTGDDLVESIDVVPTAKSRRKNGGVPSERDDSSIKDSEPQPGQNNQSKFQSHETPHSSQNSTVETQAQELQTLPTITEPIEKNQPTEKNDEGEEDEDKRRQAKVSRRMESSRLISEFHTIEKKLAITKDPLERKKLKIQQNSILGGLSNYQKTSSKAGSHEKGGQTGEWFGKVYKKFICNGKEPEKITLLDVGAIEGTSYSNFDWIETTSIDINPQSSNVLKFDFFKFPIPERKFHVVSLSLVLNFIGDLKKRSEMIRHVHNYLRPHGILYIVLPLACLKNSRYLDNDRFIKICSSLGFELITNTRNVDEEYGDDNNEVEKLQQRMTRKLKLPYESLKLSYWIFKRSGKDGLGIFDYSKSWSKVEVRKGPNRNNFCIKV